MAAQEAKWMAESDARTLVAVQEIRNAPARMKAAQKELARQQKDLGKALKACGR